jgi:2-polyprenyl-3-methyl-5-hydroxy-6-metoxy-1,4-benzoquinol methylase
MHAESSAAWANLAESIKSGKPQAAVNEEKEAEQFFPKLAAAIFPMNYTPASLIARELEREGLDGEARVLDIAAGSAVWSIPIARLGSTIKVDALDFPAVLSVAREYTKRMGVDAQYAYLPGNWRDIELESEAYDVIVLGHILHSEGRKLSEELLTRCHRALKPGGFIVIAEFLCNEERTSPATAALFAINMFLVTSDGCIFSQKELETMLNERGFIEVKRPELAGYGKTSPVMVARKKA